MVNTILLTKDDINTRQLGTHFEIHINESMVINFSKEAIDELISDYKDGYKPIPDINTDRGGKANEG